MMKYAEYETMSHRAELAEAALQSEKLRAELAEAAAAQIKVELHELQALCVVWGLGLISCGFGWDGMCCPAVLVRFRQMMLLQCDHVGRGGFLWCTRLNETLLDLRYFVTCAAWALLQNFSTLFALATCSSVEITMSLLIVVWSRR